MSHRLFDTFAIIFEHIAASGIVMGAYVIMLHHKNTKSKLESPVGAVGYALAPEIIAINLFRSDRAEIFTEISVVAQYGPASM